MDYFIIYEEESKEFTYLFFSSSEAIEIYIKLWW